MAQEQMKIGDVIPIPVDEDGYQLQFATTSSANSARTMRGDMKNSPLFTVEAYQLKWTDIPVSEASKILMQVINKASFKFYHFNVYKNRWETGDFYAINYNVPVCSLVEGEEKLDELSFQVTGTHPL